MTSTPRLPDSTDAHVGRRLRELRHTAAISDLALADAIGVSRQQLCRYETAFNRISAGMLWRAAEALGVGIWEFFPEREAAE